MAEAAPVYHPPVLLSPTHFALVEVEGRAILPPSANPGSPSWERIGGALWRFRYKLEGLDIRDIADLPHADSGELVHSLNELRALAWRVDRLNLALDDAATTGTMHIRGTVVDVDEGAPVTLRSSTVLDVPNDARNFAEFYGATMTIGPWTPDPGDKSRLGLIADVMPTGAAR